MNFNFAPAYGNVTSVTNAITATAAVVLPKNCNMVELYNVSATATVYVRVTAYQDETSPPTGDAPTVTAGYPVGPSQRSRIWVGPGCKLIRTIASAANANILIIPGNGV